MRAHALHAPVFLGLLPRQTGRCAPPAHRSFAASYSTPKIFTIYQTWRPRQGIFSFHWTTEAMEYEVPCTRPTHRSFADPCCNIFGVKLCTNATIRPYFLRFFLFSIVFGSFLFVILFFFFSPFQFLLILLVGAILRLLILLFLHFNCFCIRDMIINDIHISVILRDFSWGFFDSLGVKIHAFIGATIHPNYCCFILFY